MTPEQVTQLIEYLKNMGELAVSKGFELAMRQVYVGIVGECILLLAGVIGILVARWAIKKAKDNSYSDVEWGILGGLMAVFSAFAIPFSIYGLLAKILNPEWYAIKMMFDLVTGS